jgi:hypothetical protein
VRDIALVEGEPAVVGPGFERVQEAMGAPQPTARHSRRAPEVELIGGQPGGHARCRQGLTLEVCQERAEVSTGALARR